MRAISLLNPPPPLAALLSLLPPLKPSFPIPPPSKTLAMAKTLDESDVGISCFVSSLPGFRGVLKQRYSDFIVNEVDCDGKIVRLTSFDLPPNCSDCKEEDKPTSTDKDYTFELESFQSLCGDVDAQALKGILEKISSGMESDIAPIILSPDSDKSHRADVHNFFKKNFKFLVTDTVEGSDGKEKCIRVRLAGGGNKRGKKRKGMVSSDLKDDRPFDSRGSDNWPVHLGKFLRFNLYKENKDTQDALGVIGKMLGIQQRSFGFAGTKDKRSISTQRVTVFKQHANKLAALNSRLFGIKVGDFCYVGEGLVLGQLLGNRFTITLRGVVADSEEIVKASADGLGRNGFINYYGLQRFGSGSVPTHLVGAALLRGEWKGAVGLILDPREGERDDIREARKYYKEHGDVDMTLRKLPRYLVAERAILQCLKKCPGNYLQALKAIPRTLRMMYVHSYQSYLWNHAASMRVQKYGVSQVVQGDLVYCKDNLSEEVVVLDKFETEDDCNDEFLSDTSCEEILEEKLQLVKAVDSEDLSKGIYSFEDVVLPLPGSRIQFPENEVANVYHEMAKRDGISLTESAHGVKEFSITSMKGGYRRVFQRPVDFTWELITYTDDNVALAETDLDMMSKRKPDDVMKEEVLPNGHLVTPSEAQNGRRVPADGSEGGLSSVDYLCSSETLSPKLALKMELTLPTSCYATMAIRELQKASTSVTYQKMINPCTR
ncbi:multisubstrate pseudouridine synthase 7 [Typha angustifolia]|uniref:multisubstrate pseudouridine synthase 7 n=1 Tax=Typha angustifolia TaxID=59011 RepID=UPI003C2FD76A